LHKQIFDWGWFWENGMQVSMPLPFGPTDEADRMIVSLDSPWVQRANMVYPKLYQTLEHNDWPFAFIIVNAPREATDEEVEFFKNKGIELDEHR